MRILALPVISLALALAACGDPDRQQPNSTSAAEVPVLREAFVSPMGASDDVDSPAAWRGPDGSVILMATAKGTHRIMAYDGATGELLGRWGRQGVAPGEFRRPNGIFVHDDHVYVVERDNRRVQVLSMPDFEHVAMFGDDVLLKPYGISGFERDGVLNLWITDDFDVTGEGDARWDRRVKHFTVSRSDTGVQARLERAFGDPDGQGRLTVVESIFADARHNRLLIADEDESQRVIKVYDLDGNYTGEDIGRGVFQAEPEGIALWPCGEDGGYLLMADQSHEANRFHLFDRAGLRHAGTFAGSVVANTDGVAVLAEPAGAMVDGAFYAIHADQGVVGFSWTDIVNALGLSC
jgi:3-phytase